ncbi:MAG: ThuA domain-containing protein [Balneolaceae bacterium]|nr:ThuA domain-containing protein [Balneolaceae bacterium]
MINYNCNLHIFAFLTFVSVCLISLAGVSCETSEHRESPVNTDYTSNNPGSNTFNLTLRSRVETEAGSGIWQVVHQQESWDPNRTAIIVADMWDRHWCESATDRVGELAPVMNQVISEARDQGALIVHAPSNTLDAYQGTPQRQRAVDANWHEAPEGFDLTAWCYLDESVESDLPIDDSDGGCDKPCSDGQPCEEGRAWSSQIADIEIHDEDAISEDGQEVYNLFMDYNIENVIVMGVHTNMCVLGRSFAIRQMANLGMNVVLMRDMTDSMYNPEMPPYVTHFRGTELVTEHIEKYWAPTILSSDFTGEPAFRFAEDERTHIAFVIAEDEYEAHLTLPEFAEEYLTEGGHYAFNVIQSDDDEITAIEQIRDADLVILYVRRRHLPQSQLNWLKKYLNEGKPLIALRTSSHAFETWTEFDPEVLGGSYSGHHGNRPPDDPPSWVQVSSQNSSHPVLAGLPQEPFRAASWLYKTEPLADNVIPLMYGKVGEDGDPEPVTWVRKYGDANIFYTSLGSPGDFELPEFNRLLLNSIEWAAEK